jgi:predicted MFS family arabinose efflux permease
VGVLNGSFGAGIIVGALPGAYLTARIRVRRAALFGLALLAAASLAFGLADSFYALVGPRFVEGLGSALVWITAFTWIVSQAPEGRRGQLIGTLTSAAVVGALIGPAVGSAATTIGPLPVFALLAAFVAAVALWVWLENSPPPAGGFRLPTRSLSRPGLASGFWFIALAPLLFGTLVSLAPLKLDEFGWGAGAVGAVFLVGAALEATAHPLLGRWSDSKGFRPPVFTGLAFSFLLLLSLPIAGSAPLFAALAVASAVLFNFSLTPGTALFSRTADKEGMGEEVAFGAANVAWASGYAVGASAGGALAGAAGDTAAYYALAAVCLFTLIALRK